MSSTRAQKLIYVCLFLVVAVYLLYSSFGLFAPFWWGHHGYHGALYTLRARMSLRLGTIYPYNWSGWEKGPLNSLYMHHPIGLHHLLTLTIPVFGDREHMARLVGVLSGLFLIFALWRVGRRRWSELGGLLAVLGFVSLPFVTAFSVLCDPMFIELGCVLFAVDAFLELCERPSRRALITAVVANAVGALFMWEVFVVAPLLVLFSVGYRLSRRGRGLRLGRLHAFDAHMLAVGATLSALLFLHVYLTWKAGGLAEMGESYRARSAAPTLQAIVQSQLRWIDITYGKIPPAIGVLWLAVFVGRLASGRARLRDVLIIMPALINAIYVRLFPQGTLVHLYRVFFFSGTFVLALVDLTHDLGALVRWRAARRKTDEPVRTERSATGAMLAAAALYLIAVAPKAWVNLLESRQLMGAFGVPGYDPQRHKLRFAQEVHDRTTQQQRVILYYNHLSARKELWYYVDRTFDEIYGLRELERFKKTWPISVVMLDSRMVSADERPYYDELLRRHPASFFDGFVMIDLRSEQPGITAYRFADGPMSPAYRFFVSHRYPPLQLLPATSGPGIDTATRLGLPLVPVP
jgi:4-amino-4-deoxy-L-arabinose transferase-like glycosyltransferase